MPPQPYEYQGPVAIARFLEDRQARRGLPSGLWRRGRTVSPRSAATYDPQAAIARAYGLLVLTLQGERISAITWFVDLSLFPHFGLPRTLPD